MRCCIEPSPRGGKRPRPGFGIGTGCGRSPLRQIAAVAGVVFAALLLAGCGRAPEPVALEVFFTSQTRGRLSHCGCFSGQFGGLARLRTAVGALPPAERFGVDVGDALEGVEDYQLLKHRQVLKAYAGLGYAALNAGAREASLSAARIRALGAESPVPFISANLRDRATGAPLLKAWAIIERAGRRLALVGVIDPHALPEGPGEGVEIEPMETCLARVLPELKGKADAILLLAYADEGTLVSLAARFYEFAVILGGDVRQPAQRLVRENRSLVYYTGNDAKSYGRLGFLLGADGAVGAGAHDVTLLTDQYPENDDILALLAAYRAEARTTRLDLDDPAKALAGRVPGVRAASDYTGTETCLACHPSAAATWHASAHSRAFAALVARGADADPSCVGCHTVGFGAAGGYRREFGDAKLTNVGCESCHGPGGRHVAERGAGGPVSFQFRPLGAGDCQKCHHGEFSRPFDWDAFWPHIRHGKEPKS